MLAMKTMSLQALSRPPCRVRCQAARRLYATDHEKRTRETLKISSQLTWYTFQILLQTRHTVLTSRRLTTTAAIGAAALYYTTSSQASPVSPASPASSVSSTSPEPPKVTQSGHRHESAYASDVPKPVEDRHGDSVDKHSIAAHKNENKVREGKFSGKKFDNHVQTHSPGKPGGDFETQ
jgi:hypothetical protein